jgi:ABC-type transport system substrate-binding protein
MAESRQLTRRRFLILTGIGGGASLLVACQAAAPAAPTGAPAATAPAAAKPTEAAKPGAAAPAAAPAAQPAAVGSGQPLRVVLGAEATAIEPALDPVKSSIVIDNTMLDTLAMNTPDLKFVPWLAESWESVAPTRWRLKLKQGVKFHNGEPFNADSVVYSTQVFLTTKGIARSWFDHLSGAEKVDENTVDLITKAPSSILPSSLAFLYVFPPKYHAEQGQAGFGKQPVGTGAWKFVEWNPGVSLKVTPNPDYWGKKPAIGDIQFRWAADGSARVSLIQTGEVDLAQNIPPALTDRVEQSGAARIEQAKSIRKVFLEFNINEGPTADPRVRKALNHAIDVDSVIKTLFRGRAYGRDKGIIHEGFEGYQGDKLQAYTYDLDLAKKLLAEADRTLHARQGVVRGDGRPARQGGRQGQPAGHGIGGLLQQADRRASAGRQLLLLRPADVQSDLLRGRPLPERLGLRLRRQREDRAIHQGRPGRAGRCQAGPEDAGVRELRLQRPRPVGLAVAPAGHLRCEQQDQLEGPPGRADDLRGGVLQVGPRSGVQRPTRT